MSDKVILHVGTPKTGTSYLQDVLFRNRVKLLTHGVAYPAFAAALKQVFLEAAHEELAAAGQKRTDSAVSLLSGVHRRDVRTLGRLASVDRAAEREAPANVASQVVARWLSDPDYLDEAGQPRPLARYGEAPSFDSLVVASVQK